VRPARFQAEATEGQARAGWMETARGRVRTPCFMPVGTRGAVRLLEARDLEELGAQIVLANNYHLSMRPGPEVVGALGGLHGFTGWSGHFLTDSGGFQVFSLRPAVDDDGVTFRSTYDGSLQRFTPESVVASQELLGADIQMVLDVCTGLPATRAAIEQAGERTLAWAARARRAHQRPDQCLFGIVQGGVELDLRRRYAERTAELDFDGYALGGLSVGEPHAQMMESIEAAIPALPADRPRYLMGVGDPLSLVEGIARGVDLFDCVLPTRLARHASALTSEGRFQVKAARFAKDDGPLDPACSCSTCARYSRGYLRHLFVVGEPTAGRLLTLHNLAWLTDLVAQARAAVVEGRLDTLRRRVTDTWAGAPAR
jgi:queuine tRNA-ribosyltransferase